MKKAGSELDANSYSMYHLTGCRAAHSPRPSYSPRLWSFRLGVLVWQKMNTVLLNP